MTASVLPDAQGQKVPKRRRFDHTELHVYYDLGEHFEYLRQRRVARIAGVVEGAGEILRQAESKAKGANRDLERAFAMIKMSELDRQDAELDEAAAEHARCRIEAEILQSQTPDSAIERARSDLAAARVDMDRELHRVVPTLPPHTGQPTAEDYLHETGLLSDADYERLDEDPLYQAVRRKVNDAYRDMDKCRLAVYKQNPEWIAASAAAAAAHDREREAEKRVVLANAGTLGDKLDKHSAERAASQARVVIARGRAMIRELGGNPPPKPKDPPAPRSAKDNDKKQKHKQGGKKHN